MGSGWPSSPSPEREARCHLSGLLSRPGLQPFSEPARVCLHISPPVFAVVNTVCPIGKVINKGVETWLCRPQGAVSLPAVTHGALTVNTGPGRGHGGTRRGLTQCGCGPRVGPGPRRTHVKSLHTTIAAPEIGMRPQ